MAYKHHSLYLSLPLNDYIVSSIIIHKLSIINMTDSINIQDKPNLATPFIGTAHIVCGAGCMKRYGVRPSVCPIHLLPWAQWG